MENDDCTISDLPNMESPSLDVDDVVAKSENETEDPNISSTSGKLQPATKVSSHTIRKGCRFQTIQFQEFLLQIFEG